jgi:hypothetical protein
MSTGGDGGSTKVALGKDGVVYQFKEKNKITIDHLVRRWIDVAVGRFVSIEGVCCFIDRFVLKCQWVVN